jgi:site-specific DNA-methyltransferase (adenine-specific)
LRRLIEIFTDPGDVVIDPVCGSGSTLRAAAELGRRSFGFEINKKFCEAAQNRMLKEIQPQFLLIDPDFQTHTETEGANA